MSKQGLLDFLAEQSNTLPEETVTIKQWGQWGRPVTLRGLTSHERDHFESEDLKRFRKPNGKAEEIEATVFRENYRARYVARHIVVDGERILANENGERYLGRQPPGIIDKLFAVAQRVSGYTQDDLEEMAKNFVAGGESEPISDSPPSSDAQSKKSKGASAHAN